MKPSLLCFVLTGKTLQENVQALEKYRELVDLVEVRADFYNPTEFDALHKHPEYLSLPAILTIRRKEDGGAFTGTEGERRALVKKAASGNWAYVDLETDFHDEAFERSLKARTIRIIRSFHDFTGVPADLVQQVKKVRRGEIPKAAVMPKNTYDLYQFLIICRKLKNREKIILCMGEFDTATRILASKIGSFLSYCSLPAQTAAPGHLDPATMFSVYRFHEITSRTRLFAVIGNPIAHSFSPRIHNKSLQDLAIDAVYVPFLVDRVEAFFKIARLLKIQGFSVTIPHKKAVIPFLADCDALVDTVGACNTVIRRGRRFIGRNTDVAGFLEPLEKYFNAQRMRTLKATVIGAGGAARAVVYGLVKAGVKVLILNRTPVTAQLLADEFNAAWGPLNKEGFTRITDYADLIVQTTNVGMEPDSTGDPLSGYEFSGRELVYDLIYNPRLTRLLERALDARCKVINGEEMLVAQAHEQFRLFTGRESTFRNCYLADFRQPEGLP